MTRRKSAGRSRHAALRPTATHNTLTAAPIGPALGSDAHRCRPALHNGNHDALKADRDVCPLWPPKVDWEVGDEVL